ncbi:MAG: ABC transporter substrate-binding protein [Bilophila sp.]
MNAEPSDDLTPDDPTPLTNVRIMLQWIPQTQFAGYIMALEKGFFREEGLNVTLRWLKPGEAALVQLNKGDVEFATAVLLTALHRRAEGMPLVNIAQFMQHSGSLLVARKDKNIHTLQDLNNKTILTWGADFGLEFDLFLKRNNITPAKVLPLSASLAPFLYGLADATQAMEYGEYQRLLERGMKPEEMIVFPFAQNKVNIVGDGLYTTCDYLQNHRQTAKAVRRAVLRGWDYAFAHETETIQCAMTYCDAMQVRSNLHYQLTMLRNVRNLMRSHQGEEQAEWGTLSPQDFENARSMVIEAGLPLQNERYERFFQEP